MCECGVEISSAISQLSGTLFTWLNLAPRLGFTDGETLGCLLPHVLVFLTGRPSVPAFSGGAHAARAKAVLDFVGIGGCAEL